MLGFTALSETPLSQSATAVFANAFLPGTLAQFSTGALLYEAIAFHTLPSVAAIGEVAIEFDAQATTSMAEAIAATTINAVVTDAQASTTPTAVTASFSINTFADVDAKALITFPDISATFTADTIAFDAKAAAAIAGVELTLNNYEFADEDAQASIVLPVATSSFTVSAFSDVIGKSNIGVSSVSSNFDISSIVPSAQAQIAITGVSLALNNYEFADEDAKASITLDTITATLSVNLADPTAVVFPYQDYADEYSRQRTLFIGKQDTNNTVHITA